MKPPATRHRPLANRRITMPHSARHTFARGLSRRASALATSRSGAAAPSLRLQVSVLSAPRKRSAFTLIELLVVIAIIAILAGLAFPAVQGALESGKKAQARNDVAQLAAAVKAFQLEYGRLPTSNSTTFPETLSTNSAPIIRALIGQDTGLNPRNIVFFEAKDAKGNPPKGGRGTDNVYYDPWGQAYSFALDYNYDKRITAYGKTNLTSVIWSSSANSTDTNKIISNVQ